MTQEHPGGQVVYTNKNVEASEEQILEVLGMIGKSSPENQLNCGACGYASCRDKAIAIIQGMAEVDACSISGN